MFRCVSETVETLNETGNPMVGVVLIIVIFIAVGVISLYINPPKNRR